MNAREQTCDTPHAAVTCTNSVDHEKCSQQETHHSPPIRPDLAGFALLRHHTLSPPHIPSEREDHTP